MKINSLQSIFRLINQKISRKKIHIENCNLQKHGIFFKKNFLNNKYLYNLFPNLVLPKDDIEKKNIS